MIQSFLDGNNAVPAYINICRYSKLMITQFMYDWVHTKT